MDLLGHKEELAALKQEILGSAGTQSYVFSGAESIGKFQAALSLAQELVAEPDFEASPEALYPSDVMVLEPGTVTEGEKTKTKGIPVNRVREGLQFLTRYPSKGKYRILIIRDAHVLTEAAQNMILKTLEEPSSSALFILVTHEPGALLPTVRSRVNEKIFQPVKAEEIAIKYHDAWLTEHSIPAFFRNFGRPGVLERAQTEPELFQKKKELLTALYTITQLNTKKRLALAEELAQDVPGAIELLEWWLMGLRAQVVKQTKKEQKVQFYQFLKNIFEVIETLKNTQANARLLLEQLFFQIR